jgi:uncharacterized protein (TIRG00374 family)
VADSIFRSKSFRLVLGFSVATALLYLSTRDVSWHEVKGELQEITLAWIALALLLYWFELGLRILRWRVFLSQMKPPLPGQHIAMAFFAGYAANNVLPAKLGEAFRADLLGRLASASRLTAFGSIIVERLFDMVVILAMTAWGVWFATTTHDESLEAVSRGLTLLVLPIALLSAAVYFLVARKNLSINLRLKALTEKAQNLVHGLHALREPAGYPRLVGSTLVIWMLNSLAIWSILMALGVRLEPSQTVLLIGLTGIAAAIPAAPAGIGTLQYAFHLAAVMFDFSSSVALVASAVVQVVLLGSATLVGALCYSYAISKHLLPRSAEGQ